MELSQVEIERRNRIRLSVAAYAYEFESESIISDAEFDDLAKRIRPKMKTLEDRHSRTSEINRIKRLDKFFSKEFSADTGMWIYQHPELDRLRKYFNYLKQLGAFHSLK